MAAKSTCTTLVGLDRALGGGVAGGLITEFCGAAGVGKTQFCFTLCASAAMAVGVCAGGGGGGSVIYIDTERKFSAERLAEIVKGRLVAMMVGSGSAADAALTPPRNTQELEHAVRDAVGRVFVHTVSSCEELTDTIERLESLVVEHGCKLVLLDSIAALARQEFGWKNIAQRQSLLGRQSAILK